MEFLLNILFSKSGEKNRLGTLPIPDCQKCTLNQNVRPIHWTDSQTVTTRPIHYTRLLDRNFVPDCQTVTLYRTAWWVLCTRLPNRYIILNCLMVLCTRLPDRYIILNCLMGTLYQTTRPIHNTELSDGYFVPDYKTDSLYWTVWWILFTNLPDRFIIPNCLMGTLYQTTRTIHYTELPNGYQNDTLYRTARLVFCTRLPYWYILPDFQFKFLVHVVLNRRKIRLMALA